MFLPTTKSEIDKLGWDTPDIILVTGDTYIDSPFVGVAVIGKVLSTAGFRVAIIAQPDIDSADDIRRLGEPRLFWGVSAGCIDSMVANRTASGRRRKRDDYTPGGENNRRPDRAVIAYCNLIRRYFKNTVPIVIGGIEASLRRVPHYDFWSDKIRRSIIFDAKADYLLYGMAETATVMLAEALRDDTSPQKIRGLSYIASAKPPESIELPSYEEVADDKAAFTAMFHEFYRNNDPVTAKTLSQKHGNRYLVQNPPQHCLTTEELDRVYELGYENAVHPYYAKSGHTRALDTIRFSITTHRGCYGECNFCAIAVHQGRHVRWRSRESILREARNMTTHPQFKGAIHDVGGPTANMYGFECARKDTKGSCTHKRCLGQEVCPSLGTNHSPQISLLRDISAIKGIKRVTVASGIRYDMIAADKNSGNRYLERIVGHHVSGQLKIAPEHTVEHVLKFMGKPGSEALLKFREKFYKITDRIGKKQFLTYYIIAAHPGCREQDMRELRDFMQKKLHTRIEQVQIFTPTPSTYSTLMYWTERDPFSGKPCFVEKSAAKRERQKAIIAPPRPRGRKPTHKRNTHGR
jgi:uncharacterized radical SAM protein YgiQ